MRSPPPEGARQRQTISETPIANKRVSASRECSVMDGSGIGRMKEKVFAVHRFEGSDALGGGQRAAQ